MADKAPKGKKQVPSTASVNDATVRKKPPELKSSHEYFQNLIDAVPDIIFSVKLPERVIEWTNASIRSIGYEPDECIGRTTEFLYRDRDEFLAFGKKMEEAMAMGKDKISSERKFRRKNGEIFLAEVSAAFLKKKGKITHDIGLIRDITERKRAEEQIAQRNLELAALNDIATVTAQSLDLDGILNAALDKVLELMRLPVGGIYLADRERRKLNLVVYRGVSPEFVHTTQSLKVGKKTLEAVAAGGKLGKFLLSLEAVFKERAELKRLTSAMKKEGLSSDFSIPVLLQAKEEILGLMTLSSKVPRKFSETELRLLTAIGQQIAVAIQNARLYEKSQQELGRRRQSEEALRVSEENLRSSVDNSPFGIRIATAEGETLYVNRAFLDIYFYSTRHWRSRAAHFFWHHQQC